MADASTALSQIRAPWPTVRILLRADSGFAQDALMVWCEENHVDYLLGLAKNERLIAKIKPELTKAARTSRHARRPARRSADYLRRGCARPWRRPGNGGSSCPALPT